MTRIVRCLVVVAACGVAACGQGDRHESTSVGAVENRASTEASTATDTAAHLRKILSVFRGARDAARDRVPPEIMVEQYAQTYGADSELSRLAVRQGRALVYLIPGDGNLCLIGGGGASAACWPVSVIERGEAIASVVCSPYLSGGMIEIAGIVPDGVRSVALKRVDRTEVPVVVQGNAFIVQTVRTESPPVSAVYVQDDGSKTRQSTSVPNDASRQSCSGMSPS